MKSNTNPGSKLLIITNLDNFRDLRVYKDNRCLANTEYPGQSPNNKTTRQGREEISGTQLWVLESTSYVSRNNVFNDSNTWSSISKYSSSYPLPSESI